MQYEESNISCGVYQVCDLYGKKDNAKALEERLIEDTPTAFVVFSDQATPRSGGTKLAKELRDLIKKKKIGTLTESPVRVNPNSKNKIRVWCFGVDRKKLGTWFPSSSKKKKIDPYNYGYDDGGF